MEEIELSTPEEHLQSVVELGLEDSDQGNSSYFEGPKIKKGASSESKPTPDALEVSPEETKKEKKKREKAEAKEKKRIDKENTVPYSQLYRFATKWDWFLIVVGSLGSLGHGVLQPLFTILFGDVIDSFDSVESDPAKLLDSVTESAIWFVIIGVIAAVTSYLQVTCFMTSASNQASRMRFLYLQSLLKQDMRWYDSIDSGELTTRIATDVAKVEQGIADKVGSFLQYFAMFLGGFIIGFIKGWKLTLVIFSVSPLLVVSGSLMATMLAASSSEGQLAYSKADGVAGEVFSMIRIVAAFGGEEEEADRYAEHLKGAYKAGVKGALYNGLGMGFTMGVILLVYALAFWVGYIFIQNGEMTSGEVLTVFFSVMIGAMAIGQGAPNIAAMATAQGAAHYIFKMIDRESEIDQLSSEGIIPTETCKGEVTFKNVNFSYIAEEEKQLLVLKGMDFQLESGKTLALVGPSGCGKSTTIQLVQRFYDKGDPTKLVECDENTLPGSISLDGTDLEDLSIQWLRSQIGIVSQMPTLFASTISENIRLGAGYVVNEDFDPDHPAGLYNQRFKIQEVTQEMIIEAAKQANAHNFIMAMPDAYDTILGERGAQLSGGQKQRIAIARALIRNPKILLLDEATSALDTESERVVQEALEKCSVGRTTIVIAHRLTSIRNADKIAVVEKGKIVEIGNHDELLEIEDGKYKHMISLQQLNVDEDGVDNDLAADGPIFNMPRSHESIHSDRKVSSRSRKSYKELEEKEIEEADTDPKNVPGFGVVIRAFKLNMPETPWILLGVLGCIVSGLVWPFFALALSEVLGAFIIQDDDKVRNWVLVFVGVGVAAFFSNFFQIWAIGVAGEKLTLRMRTQSFKKIVHQPAYWFDDSHNSVGILTTRLSKDASLVRALTGDSLAVLVVQLSTLSAGLLIAFISCPKLAGVVLACIPVVGLGGMLQMKMMTGFMEDGAKVYEEAGKIALEAVDNIRTVHSLNAGFFFLERYAKEIEKPQRDNIKKSQIAGALFGFAEFTNFAIWALAFWYGAELVSSGDCDFTEMMKAITAIIFGAMTVGQISAMAPNATEGRVAAARVFNFLDLVSYIDSSSKDGDYTDDCKGNVEFKDLVFAYPTRPDVTVLNGLCTGVKSGETMAFVGESGCGKSTTIQLLERFYDPIRGAILLDGKEFPSYNLTWLRSQIGIVSQEPDLFNKTIKENIAYGFSKLDTTVVTDDQIEWAAKKANAHDFIMALPNGYDSPVGERGGLLSGGQKQRIAIARALVRDPKILLLDEATSALDSDSERIVQEALDKAREGRTTLVIAHRLATIQNADKICVIAKGVVSEFGTHSELIGKKGAYAGLVAAQTGQVF